MNARVETIHTKPMFKNLMTRKRCVIPAEGYYEWRSEKDGKQPYLFSRKDKKPMWMAGLWDSNPQDGGQSMFVIITGEPNSLASPIHDRMPCIIDDADVESWLNLNTAGDESLIIYPSELMDINRMNRNMNRADFKDAKSISII